jgi:hypothetical protein
MFGSVFRELLIPIGLIGDSIQNGTVLADVHNRTML